MFDFTDKSVAVVGSSGHLLERDYASKIDSHDIVIRFNQARVEGYEQYVGNKTTYRIVNTHTFLGTSGRDRFSEYDSNFIPKLLNQQIVINRPVPKQYLKLRSPNNPVIIITDGFWNYCKNLLQNKKDPSVGFLGTILAIKTSNKVSVFGFDQENTTKNKHYWETVKHLGGWHNFDIERNYFKQLEEQKLINIFK